MKIPRLNHEDLIATESDFPVESYRRGYNYSHPRILRPSEIPVHPAILEKDFIYSQDFLKEVVKATPEMVTADIKTIESKLNVKLGLKLIDKGIEDKSNRLAFLPFDSIIVQPKSCWIEMSYSGDPNICIGPEVGENFFYEDCPYPIPQDKAEIYAISKENKEIELQGWQTHNITYQGFPFEIFSRNFAIVFNNLGLDRL